MVTLAAVLTLLNIGVALRTLWKEWQARQGKPHPLDAALRDVALAIRERTT
jgi:hypothetical protein